MAHGSPKGGHDISFALIAGSLVFVAFGLLCLLVGTEGEAVVAWMGAISAALGILLWWALLEYRAQRYEHANALPAGSARAARILGRGSTSFRYLCAACVLLALLLALSLKIPREVQEPLFSVYTVLDIMLLGSLASSLVVENAAIDAPHKVASQQEAASTEPPAGTHATEIPPETLTGLVTRSDNVIATLADFARHHPNATLGRAIRQSGVLAWDEALEFPARRLSRSNRYWFCADTDRIESEADYDAFVAAEAALNTYQDAFGIPESAGDLDARMVQVVRNVTDLEVSHSEEVESALKSDAGGEWIARLSFAEFAEGARLPLRFAFEMDADVAEGILGISIEIPRPAAFAFLDGGEGAQTNLARAYAIRLAALCARHAFAASPAIAEVTVRGHLHGSEAAVLGLTLSRNELDAFVRAVNSPTVDAGMLPVGSFRLHASLDRTGWFVTSNESASLSRTAHQRPPETIADVCSPRLQRATGAHHVCELGINESAGRLAAWDALEPQLDGTTGSAVARLVGLHGSTNDPTVAQAADRVCRALIDGTLDATDVGGMRALFVGGTPLDTACHRASAALENPSEADFPAILASLEEALSEGLQTDGYLDDQRTAWRYFGSVAERVRYNLDLADGRMVRLVPDSYYAAHYLAARIMMGLHDADGALGHVDELMRIAPATADPVFLKVRILEDDSRLYDAIDLLVHLISSNVSPREMSVAFYRLAYLEWKVGETKLGIACYRNSMELSSFMAAECATEMAQLLASEDNLQPLSDAEAEQAISDANIPLGTSSTYAERALEAGKAAIDDRLFAVGAPLIGAYLECRPSDVVFDVYRSVRPLG